MNVRGIVVVGTHTAQHRETARFFTEVLRLAPERDGHAYTIFRLPDGGKVEVFGQAHGHGDDGPGTTAPIPEFLVDDVVAARAELEAAGVELVGPIHEDPRAGFWQLFRAPDGNVYGLASRDPSR